MNWLSAHWQDLAVGFVIYLAYRWRDKTEDRIRELEERNRKS